MVCITRTFGCEMKLLGHGKLAVKLSNPRVSCQSVLVLVLVLVLCKIEVRFDWG